MMIYRCDKFALNQSAVDQMNLIYKQQFAAFPDDPPVAAGISVMRPVIDGRVGNKQVLIGFMNRSEFRDDLRRGPDYFKLAGFDIVFDVPEADWPVFRSHIISFSAEKGFHLERV